MRANRNRFVHGLEVSVLGEGIGLDWPGESACIVGFSYAAAELTIDAGVEEPAVDDASC